MIDQTSFHNYVVEQLAVINENGRFHKPNEGLTHELAEKSWAKYDNDLFQTGRLITCGLYIVSFASLLSRTDQLSLSEYHASRLSSYNRKLKQEVSRLKKIGTWTRAKWGMYSNTTWTLVIRTLLCFASGTNLIRIRERRWARSLVSIFQTLSSF